MISLYGTAGNMAKMTVQQTKVEQKKRKNPTPYREKIHVNFHEEDPMPKGNVTAQDVVSEIVNYVNQHRGIGEGLGMLQGNVGFLKK